MVRDGALLVIDNFDSFTWNLVRMLEEEGATSFEVIREDLLVPEECARFGKILVSPGPGLPSDFPRMMECIRQFAPVCSILGICLGQQAIAEVFGGTLVRLEQVRHGVTATTRLLDPDDPLFHSMPPQFEAGLYHSWAVDPAALPASLRITAISAEGVVMSLRHESYPLRGVQFHPESIMTREGRQILRNWLRLC